MSTTKSRTKRRKTSVRCELPGPIQLPEHVHLSDDELAVVTRLVRVMRLKDPRGAYWVGPFIEWLLYLDMSDANLLYVRITRATEMLNAIGSGGDDILSEHAVKKLLKDNPGLKLVSRSSAAPLRPDSKLSDSALPDDDENQFYQLLKLWRKEYPEPPKRIEQPKGHLGRKEED